MPHAAPFCSGSSMTLTIVLRLRAVPARTKDGRRQEASHLGFQQRDPLAFEGE